RHEMHPAENYNVCIRIPGFVTETQRIPHEVGKILNFRDLIVMGEDNGITLLFKFQNLSRQIVSCLKCNHSCELSFRHRSLATQIGARYVAHVNIATTSTR